MGLRTKHKYFQVTADNTDLLSGDAQLGNLGPGLYTVKAVAAAAADGTIALSDEEQEILSASPIPVRAAAVTYPELRHNEDVGWVVAYNGPTHPTINIADGTNAEIVAYVQYNK